MAEDVVIVGGARTPFCEWVGGKRGDGKTGGLLKSVSAQELGGIAIKGALEATGTDPSSVDHVVRGTLFRHVLNQFTVHAMQVCKVGSHKKYRCLRCLVSVVLVYNPLSQALR